MKRRNFLKRASLTGVGIAIGTSVASAYTSEKQQKIVTKKLVLPLVITIWKYPNATTKAWGILSKGGISLNAIEQECRVEEADVTNHTVGKGGFPDRDGRVTLDACIMNSHGNYGAVACLENIVHPISVARKVMEDTPHVIMVAKGAEEFAVSKGFQRDNLLTPPAKKAWEKWKEKSQYKPIINIENHDTIGMLAIDKNGDISGGCTTSGMAFKMAGRVGDSPIIGSGLFIDNNVGGATATGMGEEVLKTVGTFLIVELMRQGKSPQEACEEAIHRIVTSNPNYKKFQVGYIAVNKQGEVGAYCIHEHFSYQLYQNDKNQNFKSGFHLKRG